VPETISYQITLNCPIGADVRQQAAPDPGDALPACARFTCLAGIVLRANPGDRQRR